VPFLIFRDEFSKSSRTKVELGYLLQRLVVEANQLLGAQSSQSVGTPLIVAKFDFCHGRCKQLDDGSNLAAHEAFFRHILENSNFGEKFHLPNTSFT
jgi:hypothetical protein